MGKTYPTRVDWWLYPTLGLPVIGGGATMIGGLVSGHMDTVVIGAISLSIYLLVLWGLVLPMRYALGDDGFRLQSGRMKLHVPFDRLVSAELTGNMLSSPALSLKRIRIRYQKPNGKETWVQISPPDREAFLADLVAASTRHQLVDGKVVGK